MAQELFKAVQKYDYLHKLIPDTFLGFHVLL